MLYYKNFKNFNIDKSLDGKREKYSKNIYTFDIETTTYLWNTQTLKVYPNKKYLKFKEQDLLDNIQIGATMYIWQFGINDTVFFGRTWEEFIDFLDMLEQRVFVKKYVYVHNLSYEFQFLKSILKFSKVLARKTHKVMSATATDYNIEFRCTLMLSNCSLEYLAEVYQLPVKKQVGFLDYNKIRSSITKLSKKELKYCEYDCIVVYYFILFELQTYKHLNNIPLTNTGHVRKELKEKLLYNKYYTNKVRKSINTDPYIFNLLTMAFAGGYTHANYLYTDEILKDIVSYDFTSSYPYVMGVEKFPSSEFRKCNIDSLDDMIKGFAYLLIIKIKNAKSKYLNNFLSYSKAVKDSLKNAKVDNGRLISFDEGVFVLTDVDVKYLIDCYNSTSDFSYEIMESYYSNYNYLPKQLIEFILEKYVKKTAYKNVEDKIIEYQLEKGKFNSIYGMTVTNIVKAMVEYDNNLDWLPERDLTNDEISEILNKEKENGFLSFSYGTWVTAYARRNLIQNIIALDKYVVYCDTDSIKLLPNYDKSVIINYNRNVIKKIKKVCKDLSLDINKYMPKDIYGIKHCLGLFDNDGSYIEFITQGAKKYAYKYKDKKDNIKIGITVAGVPKKACKQLKSLEEFKDGYVFEFKYTNKLMLAYIDNQQSVTIRDYQGNFYKVTDKTSIGLVPTTYVLGKEDNYESLVSSSDRQFYKLGNNENYLNDNQFIYKV